MSVNRTGHLSADIITAGGREEFRVTGGLYYALLNSNSHFIEASNGQGKQFLVYLPLSIESGSHKLELGQAGSPMIIHVTGNSEAELYPGILELTVGGDAQFAGSFSGTDADGLEVKNGSFRLAHEADT